MKRVAIIIVCFFFLGASAVFFHIRVSTLLRPRPVCDHCNVVLIDIDDLSADHMPCYGYERNTMPNLCRFADQNITFQNAFSQSTWTFPSEASIFSSLYLSNHRMNSTIGDELHPSIHTLAERFYTSGYTTKFIGDNREADMPQRSGIFRGFDSIQSLQNAAMSVDIPTWNAATTSLLSPPSHQPAFLELYSIFVAGYHGAQPIVNPHFLFDRTFTTPSLPDAYAFTEQTKLDTEDLLRYYIYEETGVAHVDLYQRILHQIEYATSTDEARRAFLMLPLSDQQHIFWLRIFDVLDPNNPMHQRYARDLYDEWLRQLDTYLGTFFTSLEHTNAWQHTIVIITSDHGENLGAHSSFGHGEAPYETQTHVPLIIHIPGITGRTVPDIVQLVDLYPTLLADTGIPTPSTIAGRDLNPLILNSEHHRQDQFAISEFIDANVFSQAIRTPEWLFMTRQGDPHFSQLLLYRESSDPQEISNVASIYPDVVKTLQTKLIHEISRLPVYPQTNGF